MKPTFIRRRPLLHTAASLLAFLLPATASASVFRNSARWDPVSTGQAVIPVCIVEGSSAQQKDSDCGGCIHDDNPSLNQVLTHVKKALASSWERTGSVRFVDWRPCAELTPDEQERTVGLYIHPDTGNAAYYGDSADGRVTAADPGVHFKPWGNDTHCITYDAWTTHMQYSFDCVEQYAIHEFGHVLGFEHEWTNPATPDSCSDKAPVSSFASSYPSDESYTVVNAGSYDWDSIMTYDSDCAHVTGVRFGSKNLSAWDDQGLRTVYPTPTPGAYDVGVIPDSDTCGPGAEPPVVIFMDDEDSDNGSSTSGWAGATGSGSNTTLRFCRVDGSRLAPMDPGPHPPTTAHYAVLRLGPSCPPGSIGFSRKIENEDDGNDNYHSGSISPGSQTSQTTTLELCLFRPDLSASRMTAFPDLGFTYGVFAGADFTRHQGTATGSIYSDDEDDDNDNQFNAPDPQTQADVLRFMDFTANTRMRTVKVDGFRGWAATEPNNSNNEDCAEMYTNSAQWNDSTCTNARRFACRNDAGGWYITTQSGSWYGGFAACAAETGGSHHFALPVSGADNRALQAAALARGAQLVWMNFSDLVREGTWASEAGFSMWSPGEPNNPGVERCAAIDPSGGWNSLSCTLDHRFACKNANGEWYITDHAGDAPAGTALCQSETSGAYHFATPASIEENEALRLAVAESAEVSVWIGYADVLANGWWLELR